MNAIVKRRITWIIIVGGIIAVAIAFRSYDDWVKRERWKSEDVVKDWARATIENTKWTKSSSPPHRVIGREIYVRGYEEIKQIYDHWGHYQGDGDKYMSYSYDLLNNWKVDTSEISSIIYIERKDENHVSDYKMTERFAYSCVYHLYIFDVKKKKIVAESNYHVDPPPEQGYYVGSHYLRGERLRGPEPWDEIYKFVNSLPPQL